MSNQPSARDRRSQRREARRRKQSQRRIILIVVAVLVVGGIVAAILLSGGATTTSSYTSLWQEIPEMDDYSHVPEGNEIIYNSNPPTSGQHFDNPAPEGFYEQVVPDGNLVHSMEHGYVIIWYNCDDLSDDECTTLQDDIQTVMNRFNNFKMIGVERPGMDSTIALTSWMMLDKFNEFDAERVRAFYNANVSSPRAPEPNAR